MKWMLRPPEDVQANARLRLWIPAAAFVAVALVEVAVSMSAVNFVERALAVHRVVLRAACWSCWLSAAAVAVSPSAWRRARRHLDALRPDDRRPLLWPGLLCIGATAIIGFVRYCEFRGFQLPQDTAIIAQVVFNTFHGFYSSILGGNYLSVHFAFTLNLLSPILFLWKTSLSLLVVQCVALGSIGLAAFLLAYSLKPSSLNGFLAMLLVYSNPYFFELASGSLNHSLFYAPFLLWSLVFAQRRSWAWCLALLALGATTSEHFMFSLAGLGLYACVADGKPSLRYGAFGALAIGAAAAVWFAELSVMNSFRPQLGASYWEMYAQFGPSREDILWFVLHHPFIVLERIVYPAQRLFPMLRLLAYGLFLPLLSPLQAIPFAVAAMPSLLATGSMHELHLHYSTFIFGSFIFAAVHGITRLSRRLDGSRLERVPLVLVLAVAGFGFRNASPVLKENWRPHMFQAAPKLIEQVPDGASLWVDEYLSSWVACRRQLKPLSFPAMDLDAFARDLFRPEFLLIQKGWIVHSDPKIAGAIISFLAENGYIKLADAPDLILLKDPRGKDAVLAPKMNLPKASDEQELLVRGVIQRLLIGEQGGTPPPLPYLTKEQMKLANYTQYLLLRH